MHAFLECPAAYELWDWILTVFSRHAGVDFVLTPATVLLGVLDRDRWKDVGAEHRRTFRLTDAAALRVDDEVRFSKGPQPVAARLHLPDAELVEASADQVLARTGGVTVRIGVEGAALEAEPCDWFPRMGVRRPGLRVVVRPPAGGAELRFTTTVEAVSA